MARRITASRVARRNHRARPAARSLRSNGGTNAKTPTIKARWNRSSHATSRPRRRRTAAVRRARQGADRRATRGILQVRPGDRRARRDGRRHRLRAVFGAARSHSHRQERSRRHDNHEDEMHGTSARSCLRRVSSRVRRAARLRRSTGTVEGKVIDQQGAVLPGVNVTLTGPRGSQTHGHRRRRARSDSSASRRRPTP